MSKRVDATRNEETLYGYISEHFARHGWVPGRAKLMEETGLKPSSLSDTLARLVGDGRLINPARGVYIPSGWTVLEGEGGAVRGEYTHHP